MSAKPKQFTLKTNNPKQWIRMLSGIFNLHPKHIIFVAVMIQHMVEQDKDMIDQEVRQYMMKTHKISQMQGIYRIMTKLKKAGIVDSSDRLHPLLRVLEGKQVKVMFHYDG